MLPRLPEGSLVITFSDAPRGFLVPQWPGRPAVISAITNLSRPGQNDLLQRRIAARVAGHRGPIYVLKEAAALPPVALYLLDQYQLAVDPTACVPADAIIEQLVVCRTIRRPLGGRAGFEAGRPTTGNGLIGAYLDDDLGDPGGLWTGSTALISFPSDALAAGKSLIIEGTVPFALFKRADGNLKTVIVTVRVNGISVASKSVGPEGDFAFAIAPAAVARAAQGGTLGVEIVSSMAVKPSDVGAGPDVRALGMRIRRVSFDP